MFEPAICDKTCGADFVMGVSRDAKNYIKEVRLSLMDMFNYCQKHAAQTLKVPKDLMRSQTLLPKGTKGHWI